MASAVLAWSGINLYEMPDGAYVWGREFELLPAGTMFTAGAALHGLVGYDAEPYEDQTALIDSEGPLLIFGTRGTLTKELAGYQEDLLEGFRIKQLQNESS